MEGREIVNDCYIIQGSLGTDACCDLVGASAMFAATRFLLRFFKPGIPPEAIEAFRIRTVGSYNVRHRAIVDAIEIDRSDARVFVSSEFGGQKPLRSVLAEGAAFPLELAVGFVLELAQGLDAFHSRGLVYGTLDADSVWAARDAGEVIELRLLKPGYLDLVPWYDREDGGTLERFAYLAPEVKGVAPYEIGPWSDVYSLGVHLYRFFTGLLPFRRQAAERARGKSVSVLHVAKALARRGVPESLVRVAVRCVRRNPKLRYRSCVELITDLKEVLAQRSRENEAAGLPDPARGIAYLNRERERLGATQYVRTLETVEYFRAVAQAGVVPAESGEARRFPFDPGLAAIDGMGELEELESVESEDDDAWEAVRIAAESMKAVEAERVRGIASMADEMTKRRPYSERAYDSGRTEGASSTVPEAPAGGPAPRPAAFAEAGSLKGAPVAPPAPAAAPVERSGTGKGAEPSAASTEEFGRGPAAHKSEPRRGAAASTRRAAPKPALAVEETPVIRWRAERVRSEAAASRLLAGFDLAKSGRGSFGFLQRPADARTLAVLRRALALMGEQGILVDAGSCAAGSEAVCARIVAALRTFVGARPRRERRKLAGRSEAFMASLPLPSYQELVGGDLAAHARIDATARALAGFGSRSRPLVLVVGDAERAARPLHELFLALAVAARRTPFCGIAFHGDAQAPDWHTLARGRPDPAGRR
ncbi:MAG: hypothetical protein JXA15_11510 [Spirochaetales bacterium]|nr:hypothetical protein [Spirochaetales bacterium]